MIKISNWNVAGYLRLSKEDLELIEYYIDDGYSGTNFNRPGFEKLLQDMKNSEIANELNSNNVLTPASYKIKNNNIEVDKKWNVKMINVILQNRVYTGDLIQGKKKVESYRTHKLITTNKDEWIIVENNHEPIISKEEFDEVQEILNKNKSARSNKEKDLFYNFLKCADCGSSFTVRKVKNYEYYHCTSYVRNGACTSHSIRKDKLVEIVSLYLKMEK